MQFDQMYRCFYDFCSTVSATLSSVVDVVARVASANYQIVSIVCNYVALIATTLFWLLELAVYASLNIIHHICDFTSDLFGCFCTLCYLIWKIVLLLYKIVCLMLSGIETLAVCIWTGSYVTVTTLRDSAVDVLDSCGMTWSYGMDLSKSFMDTLIGGFSMLGSLAVSIVKGIFSGLGYGFASLLECSWKSGHRLCRFWENLTSKLAKMFTFSREAYLGILLCCLLYVTISEMIKFFKNRGVSICSWWQSLTRSRQRRPQYMQNMYGIDSDFESDFDYESDENDRASEGTITEDSDNDQSDEHNDESNDSDEDDSEGSLNSQTFSSDDSDHEIEVQLPAPTERYNLRSRSSTPSWAQKTDMTSSDYENEIEREKDKRKCVVCQDQSKSVLILPCRHMCLCVDCADRIVRSRMLERRVCPLCRQRIQKVMNVYV